ncbi:EXOSTOSIN HEPARAN SULFATE GLYCOSYLTRANSFERASE -RELATED [Salix koriyanagi]|uniref:EXOSTOSIN HEPARAN SULFATE GLYCOSYLTRANSFERASE -RELATED n=3 Tax=Salix TaxID=40685 RepID=A0A9Q0W2F3_9ROSI|nr:EXOSTOSIN HEPARAN SULFATE GLYCOSYLTRANSFERASE -RELATED [Salix koriyanagi]
MELCFQLPKLLQNINRRWLLVLGVVAVTHIMFQFLLLPYGNALRSLFPNVNDSMYFAAIQSSEKSAMVRYPLTVDKSSLTNYFRFDGVLENADDSNGGGEEGRDDGTKQNSEDTDHDFSSEETDMDILDDVIQLEVDRDLEDDFPSEDVIDRNETFASDRVKTEESNSVLKLANEARLNRSHERNVKSDHDIPTDNVLQLSISQAHKEFEHANSTLPVESQAVASSTKTTYLKSNGSSSVGPGALKSDSAATKNDSVVLAKPGKKKMRCEMPPKSVTLIDEMNSILVRHRRSSRSMRPRWSSARDQEILAARSQIESAPAVVHDRDLYAPLFRNVSKFKRSYDLMERTLKIYIYKEGKKPIFHLPILKGLYASEGWFMKLMQGNRRFLVKDPRKAHLFYMPFSSRMLEYTLYVRNSHNRTNLRLYMKSYAESIAAKYPYWNRTGGADHFLVACHDWAPYETRHHMEHCIKALCNADVTAGFKIGRDVSLPETYVRSARNPLRDLGGKPPSQRNILAFYAGNMHGYLRPILLKYWKDKDPDMEIFGPMPPGVASKMNYIQHMKRSKYCICPKGYEVNSPRVVEAIFYECVPVIISDNFVPPFFEVLDWGAFSVILAEKDIPNLKEILLSIPKEKYLQMQLGVRKAQRHFLWHASPVKYDLFYMTLHSIWYNRVYQIKPR